VLRTVVKEDRSRFGIVQIGISVKRWITELPSVERARPARCPRCGGANREPGKALGLHGHGLRCRQIRGPLTPEGPPEIAEVLLRRYRCQRCQAVIAVGPDGLLRRRFFTAMAIAVALATWSLGGQSAAEVRTRISPWSVVGATATRRWSSLVR
jgi:hypothetical protein